MAVFGRKGARYAALAAAIAALITSGLMTFSPGETVNASPTPAVSADVNELLSKIAVVQSIPDVPGYERGCGIDKKTNTRQGCVFGPAWNDPTDHSGCDTRNRLLKEKLQKPQFKAKTGDCKVIDGYLDPDPYTGRTVPVRDVDVDHIVPLRRAWNAGAWSWDVTRRQVFANDLTELIAVSAHANRSKGDGGLDEWLPDYQPCAYVARYLTVAVKYQLPISSSERDIVAARCA